MKYSYKTAPEVCSESIEITLSDDNIITAVKFNGGCPGSLAAVSALTVNKNILEAEKVLSGIRCGNKNTSCPDQLAKALKKIIVEKNLK